MSLKKSQRFLDVGNKWITIAAGLIVLAITILEIFTQKFLPLINTKLGAIILATIILAYIYIMDWKVATGTIRFVTIIFYILLLIWLFFGNRIMYLLFSHSDYGVIVVSTEETQEVSSEIIKDLNNQVKRHKIDTIRTLLVSRSDLNPTVNKVQDIFITNRFEKGILIGGEYKETYVSIRVVIYNMPIKSSIMGNEMLIKDTLKLKIPQRAAYISDIIMSIFFQRTKEYGKSKEILLRVINENNLDRETFYELSLMLATNYELLDDNVKAAESLANAQQIHKEIDLSDAIKKNKLKGLVIASNDTSYGIKISNTVLIDYKYDTIFKEQEYIFFTKGECGFILNMPELYDSLIMKSYHKLISKISTHADGVREELDLKFFLHIHPPNELTILNIKSMKVIFDSLKINSQLTGILLLHTKPLQ